MKNAIIVMLSCFVIALIIVIIFLCNSSGEKIKNNTEPRWDNVKRVQ